MQDAFYIERLDKYMGHGFGVADPLFAAHFGESWVYGVDMLGPHPGEALEPTLEGAKVLQVSRFSYSPVQKIQSAFCGATEPVGALGPGQERGWRCLLV